MAEPVLKYEVKNEIAYITLNRPHRRNALNDELSHELIKVWPKFEKDDTARVGILRGEGRDRRGAPSSGRLRSSRPIPAHTRAPPPSRSD